MKINLPLFNNADKRIINLESPISNNDYVESKNTLFENTDSLGLLKKMKVEAVNLANNHIQDRGFLYCTQLRNRIR
jgi:poly-gamma-glutamate synthesis protein (capsule biosynthesis protein)